jgi:predicted RNA-binding Zn ribbon-like protein
VTWPATRRYDLRTAPGALGIVQDLLNTVAAGRPHAPDLLAELSAAQDWAGQALRAWAEITGQPAPALALDEAGLEQVRGFREDLHAQVATGATVPHTAPATLRLTQDGTIRCEPRGTSWRTLVSVALAAALQAQQAGTWRRLKTCRNPRCRVAFYDHSRNNSGVWHDVRGCGNAANLRAHRARKRGHIPT